jgi:ABC-2 type transport system ATP-binding protein
MDEAERCDHVAMLDGGKVIALDRPAALQAAIGGEMLALRVSDARRSVAILGEVPGVRRAVLFGDTIHATLGSRARDWPAARSALERAGIDVLAADDVEPSLEDVFMERVARDPRVAR